MEDGGELPLVYGMHWLCTTELMGMIFCGQAKGNVSAYNTTGDKVVQLSVLSFSRFLFLRRVS